MKKRLSLTSAALTLTANLLLSGCSEQTNNDDFTATQQLMTDPINVPISSLNELMTLFDKYHYNSASWQKGNREVPRITFAGVNKNWGINSDKLQVQTKKDVFFRLMTPLILISNEKIMYERGIIKSSPLSSPALKTIALKYRLIENKQSNFNEKLREQLLQRVDILPPSLALAQSAKESGWASSRFTIKGNAFFGQWDFSGNGMKPLQQRKELGNYGIARFVSPLASVEGYMLNINSNRAYQKLRILRAQLRADNKTINGYQLAATLDKYSERGQAYIDGLQSMINYNKLAQVDQAYLADNRLIYITTN